MSKPSPNGNRQPPTIDLGPWWIWPFAVYLGFGLWFNLLPMLIVGVILLAGVLVLEAADRAAKRRAREARSR